MQSHQLHAIVEYWWFWNFELVATNRNLNRHVSALVQLVSMDNEYTSFFEDFWCLRRNFNGKYRLVKSVWIQTINRFNILLKYSNLNWRNFRKKKYIKTIKYPFLEWRQLIRYYLMNLTSSHWSAFESTVESTMKSLSFWWRDPLWHDFE